MAAIKPTTNYEQEFWERGLRCIAGVDEVGRGAAVSAVFAAAVVLPAGFSGLADVRDSKMLSSRARQGLATQIRRQALAVAVGAASVPEIERFNIRGASALAMRRALRQLQAYDHALIDGLPMWELSAEHATAIVDGDALCLSIACASIVAKVARDGLLARLATRYPVYGWEHNAGYLTAEHRDALRRYGPTRHHRSLFLRRLMLDSQQ